MLQYRQFVNHVRRRNLKPQRYRNGVPTMFGTLAMSLMLPEAACFTLHNIDGSKELQHATYTTESTSASNIANQSTTVDSSSAPPREEARGKGSDILSTSEATEELDNQIEFSFIKGGKCALKVANHVIATVNGEQGSIDFVTLPSTYLPSDSETRKKLRTQSHSAVQKLLKSDEQSINSGGTGKFD